KVVFSVPFRKKKFTGFTRFSFDQLQLPTNKYTTAEWLLSSVIQRVSANVTNSAVYTNPKNPLLFSNFSLGFRFPKGIRFTPQAQYEYNTKNFSMMKCELEKNLFNKGFLLLTYEKNVAE